MLVSRPQWVAGVLAAAGLGAVGFIPLFEGPGYEAALAAGLILPALASVATAVEVCAARPVPLNAVARGAASGVVLAALGLSVMLLHGLRAGFCDPFEGISFYALGPGFGGAAGGVWGAATGLLAVELRRGRAFAAALAFLGPLCGVAGSLWRFYTSAMVFAFDPFFGFFAGTLYDTVITGFDRLATYRVGTSLTLFAVTAFAAHCYRRTDGRVGVRRLPGPGLALLGGAAALGSVAIYAAGPRLGHYQTTVTLREALGHSAMSRRCEVIYSSGILKRDAHALARECDAHVEQLERYFETRGPQNIAVFLFASPEQKDFLTGAARTYIAKPWRREIYIQRGDYPHRVLRHELAHVVAGAFGDGPFRISGPLGGLIPDPGRIEGVAVAAAPREDDLSLMQWAKAMRDLKLLPGLDRVFKLTFLGEPSARAYTVAGAFVEWFKNEHGVIALRRWYGGERLAEIAGGKGLSALERDFFAALDRVKVKEEAMLVARARFDQPAIFGRRCPHVVDRLTRDAMIAFSQLDIDRARETYGKVLELDPHNVGARLGLGSCALRDGRVDNAREIYARVADDGNLDKSTRAQAREALADVDLALGHGQKARQGYDEVARTVVDDDRLRTLDVKRYAADHGDARAIVAYIVGDVRVGPDPAHAAAELGAWSAAQPKLGLADYLLARSYFGRGRWDLAAQRLDSALEKDLPLPRVAREAINTRLIIACGLGQRETVQSMWTRLRQDRGLSDARLDVIGAFVERCGVAPAAESSLER